MKSTQLLESVRKALDLELLLLVTFGLLRSAPVFTLLT